MSHEIHKSTQYCMIKRRNVGVGKATPSHGQNIGSLDRPRDQSRIYDDEDKRDTLKAYSMRGRIPTSLSRIHKPLCMVEVTK